MRKDFLDFTEDILYYLYGVILMFRLSTQMISNRDIGIDYRDDLSVCEPHIHTFFEIAYTISGEAIHTLDGESVPIKSGDYVVIQPGIVHYYEKTTDKKLTVMNCIFTGDFVYPSIENNTVMDLLKNPMLNINTKLIKTSPAHCIYHDEDNFILNILNLMKYEYERKQPNYTLVMKNFLLSILIKSVRTLGIDSANTKDLLLYIKDYVSVHYAENNTLEHMASHMNYTPQYLSSKFKEITGETYKHFLQKTRIDVARHLLQITNMPIHDISLSVGYSDVKYFSELFKKLTKCTPRQYKSLLIANSEKKYESNRIDE